MGANAILFWRRPINEAQLAMAGLTQIGRVLWSRRLVAWEAVMSALLEHDLLEPVGKRGGAP